MHEYF